MRINRTGLMLVALLVAALLSLLSWYAQRDIREDAVRHLEESLSTVLEPRAMAIQLQSRRYGLKVATVADRAFVQGSHRVRWDGRDRDGAPAASGAYLVQVRGRSAGLHRGVAADPVPLVHECSLVSFWIERKANKILPVVKPV